MRPNGSQYSYLFWILSQWLLTVGLSVIRWLSENLRLSIEGKHHEKLMGRWFFQIFSSAGRPDPAQSNSLLLPCRTPNTLTASFAWVWSVRRRVFSGVFDGLKYFEIPKRHLPVSWFSSPWALTCRENHNERARQYISQSSWLYPLVFCKNGGRSDLIYMPTFDFRSRIWTVPDSTRS